ncbi:MAG: hypothetical protein ABIK79_17100 [Chloroflexota bacterium]|nr:hypothetical protein [Anaerolineae bacterium]
MNTKPDPGDRLELIEKVARRVERWGLVTPAVLFLELGKPLSFVGSQILLLAQPLWGPVASQYADLFEDPRSLDQLLARLERCQTGTPIEDA